MSLDLDKVENTIKVLKIKKRIRGGNLLDY